MAGDDRALRQELGLGSATMLIIGSMIGSGIFFVPAGMVLLTGSAWWVLTAFLVGGVLSLVGALVFCELAAAYPRAGGQAVYLREAFGRLPAFLFTWASFTGVQSAAIAAIAVAFAATLDTLLGGALPGIQTPLGPLVLPKWGVGFVAVGLVWLLTLVNHVGVRRGAWLNNVATIGKIVGLLFVVVAAFLFGTDAGNFAGSPQLLPLSAIGLAVAAALFAYDGWAQPTFVASEIKEPSRNVPRALLLGVGTVTLAYLVVSAAYLWVLPVTGITAGTAMAEEVTLRALGPAAAVLTGVAILVSTLGATNAYVLTSPRIYYDEAREGAFPHAFGRLSRFDTPGYGLVYQGIWASLLALTGTFDQLALLVVFVVYLFYVLTALGHLRLRRRAPERFVWFRMPFWPVPWIVFVTVAGAILVNFVLADIGTVVRAAVLIVLGLPVYAWTRRTGKATQAAK